MDKSHEYQFDADKIAQLEAENAALRKQIEELKAEVTEQARLNGMGSEREAAKDARIEELAAVLAMKDEALEWAQQNIDCIEDADERDRCSKHIDKVRAFQPHASLVAKIKADAVMQAFEWAWAHGSLMPKDAYAYVKRIERGEVK